MLFFFSSVTGLPKSANRGAKEEKKERKKGRRLGRDFNWLVAARMVDPKSREEGRRWGDDKKKPVSTSLRTPVYSTQLFRNKRR